MNVTKKEILKGLILSSDMSYEDCSNLLESFLGLIKINTESKKVNLSGYGTFSYKKTPSRIGRNPKTMQVFEIKSFKKLVFKPSSQLKKRLN